MQQKRTVGAGLITKVNMEQYETVYREQVLTRIQTAFAHLEREVEKGRIQYYGVSGAFYQLRPTEPAHMLLEDLISVAGPHFRFIQFPLNFAETDAIFQ